MPDVFILQKCMLLVPMRMIQIPAPSQRADWVGHTAVCVQHVLDC